DEHPTAGQAESERPKVPYRRASSGVEGVLHAFRSTNPPAFPAEGMALVLGVPLPATCPLLSAARTSIAVGCRWLGHAPPADQRHPTCSSTTCTMPRSWHTVPLMSVDRSGTQQPSRALH